MVTKRDICEYENYCKNDTFPNENTIKCAFAFPNPITVENYDILEIL